MTKRRQRVQEIIAGVLQAPVADVEPGMAFRSLPNADSMKVLQIVLETEQEFGIEIAEDVTFRVQTVDEFLDLVDGLCAEQASA